MSVIKLFPKDGKIFGGSQTLQSALRGNVTTFSMNMRDIVSMVEGHLLPQLPAVLPSVLSIAYVGPGVLSKDKLYKTFRVRCSVVATALAWLKTHNAKYHGDVEISDVRLKLLPKDNMPDKIMATLVIAKTMRKSSIRRMTTMSRYIVSQRQVSVFETHPSMAQVIPLQFIGVHDTDATALSARDLLASALTNLSEDGTHVEEGTYFVTHGRRPVCNFSGGHPQGLSDPNDINIWEKAYPVLFPYGVGGFEAVRERPISLIDHIRWALEYQDGRFRWHPMFPFHAFSNLQKRQILASAKLFITSADFDSLSSMLDDVTRDTLVAAGEEERHGQAVSNPSVVALCRRVHHTIGRVVGSDASRESVHAEIWATLARTTGTTENLTQFPCRVCDVWLTINPDDLHDPIVQVFAGGDVDLDRFDSSLGPSKERRAHVVASDPFAATKFFNFLISNMLETLVGIRSTPFAAWSTPGVFGKATAYISIVECQGHGTLHLHSLIWLQDMPTTEELQALLTKDIFREQVIAFIRTNFRVHLDEFDGVDMSTIPANNAVAYSHPPDPYLSDDEYRRQARAMEISVVWTKQVHTCKRGSCKKLGRDGQWYCRRRAPWPLSEHDTIEINGTWAPKRTFGFMNTWVPAMSVNLRCNCDGKLLTNGADTRHLTYYVSMYTTKKQGRSYNMSAVMAKGLAYHFAENEYIQELWDRQRSLLVRACNTLTREQEVPTPMVMSYLMGWGDRYMSHHYSAVFWTLFVVELKKTFTEFDEGYVLHRILLYNHVPTFFLGRRNAESQDAGRSDAERQVSIRFCRNVYAMQTYVMIGGNQRTA
ncbi:hypothetical protein BC834DRAFT_826866 [Gloeopeniophorella convolvens]|nr:hypothetical protein BC834DRAFT_826866 [Gloeopeniophorella convolvens]